PPPISPAFPSRRLLFFSPPLLICHLPDLASFSFDSAADFGKPGMPVNQTLNWDPILLEVPSYPCRLLSPFVLLLGLFVLRVLVLILWIPHYLCPVVSSALPGPFLPSLALSSPYLLQAYHYSSAHSTTFFFNMTLPALAHLQYGAPAIVYLNVTVPAP